MPHQEAHHVLGLIDTVMDSGITMLAPDFGQVF
jgi:hypothetical protein